MPRSVNLDNGGELFNIDLDSQGNLNFNANDRDGNGNRRLQLNDDSGTLNVGGDRFGALQLLSDANTNTIFIGATANQATALLGGSSGQNGVIGLFNSSGSRTVNMQGSTGNVTITGTLNAATKNFCIPHPLAPDAAQLVHSSIEGAECAVFYRGEGSLENGTANVLLPPYFEALTRRERRTVQLTPVADADEPISPLAASAVRNGAFQVRGLDRANPEQRFYWEVKAVRADIAPLVVEVPHASTVESAEPVTAGVR